MPGEEFVVEAKELNKRFGETRAVRDLDLRIPRGRITCLLGPSASGKTTLIRLMLGTNELFQTIPVSAGEALLGKFLSYLLITSGIGALLTVAIVFWLQVPLFGDPRAFLLQAVLEIATSLGWGFLISAVWKRESQAAQLTMILLLTSVFFSGLFLELPSLLPPVRIVSYALPVTYAIASFQEIMLAGVWPAWWRFAALGGLTSVSLGAAWRLYSRQFRLA